MTVCPICLTEIKPLKAQGRPAKYCSGRCRVRAHRLRKKYPSIPLEMIQADRWTRHVNKRPVQADGRPASSTKPETWASFETVNASPVGHGYGFMLGNGFACIDLDDSIDADRNIKPWAQDILASLPASYVERSLSGCGLHVFGHHPERTGFNRRVNGHRVEFYSQGRFIAVTGDVVGKCLDLADFVEPVKVLF